MLIAPSTEITHREIFEMLNEGNFIEKLEALAADLAFRLESADDKTAVFGGNQE